MQATHEQSMSTFKRLGLLRLTWPLIAVTMLTLLATLANSVVLSAQSADLNAAVATANQILGPTYDISVLFSIGALVVIAQRLGAQDEVNARRSVIVALRASVGLGLVIAVVVGGFAPFLIDLVNTPSDIAGPATQYLWIAAIAMLFNAYIVAGTSVLRAYGKTLQLLLVGVAINILDIALLILFVMVLDWSAVGAALPSLIVRGVGVGFLHLLMVKSAGVHVFSPLSDGGAMVKQAKRMARLSVPSVLENAAFNLAVVASVAYLNVLGTDTINGRSYAFTLTALVTGLVLAVAQGNETLVGWDVGEDAASQARRRTLVATSWTAGLAAAGAASLYLLAEPALSIFGPSRAVVDGAKDVLLLSIVLLPLSAATSIIYGALRSASDVFVPMVYSLVGSLAVLMPLSWLFISRWDLGLRGAVAALIAAEAVKGGLLLRRLLGAAWGAVEVESDGQLVNSR